MDCAIQHHGVSMMFNKKIVASKRYNCLLFTGPIVCMTWTNLNNHSDSSVLGFKRDRNCTGCRTYYHQHEQGGRLQDSSSIEVITERKENNEYSHCGDTLHGYDYLFLFFYSFLIKQCMSRQNYQLSLSFYCKKLSTCPVHGELWPKSL